MSYNLERMEFIWLMLTSISSILTRRPVVATRCENAPALSSSVHHRNSGSNCVEYYKTGVVVAATPLCVLGSLQLRLGIMHDIQRSGMQVLKKMSWASWFISCMFIKRGSGKDLLFARSKRSGKRTYIQCSISQVLSFIPMHVKLEDCTSCLEDCTCITPVTKQ